MLKLELSATDAVYLLDVLGRAGREGRVAGWEHDAVRRIETQMKRALERACGGEGPVEREPLASGVPGVSLDARLRWIEAKLSELDRRTREPVPLGPYPREE